MSGKAKCGQCHGTFSKTAMYQSRVTGGWYCKGWDACDQRVMRRAKGRNIRIAPSSSVSVDAAATSNVPEPSA